jgi:hypothetical protein
MAARLTKLSPTHTGHHGWTFVFISVGLGLIACCALMPQAEHNRRLSYEVHRLKSDLDHLDRQVAANGEFISRIGTDVILTERLAQRQMKMVRQGSSVLDIKDGPAVAGSSPYALVAVDPAQKLEPYQPVGGPLVSLAREPKKRLYSMGIGLMLMAMGLVLGYSPRS